ncbi:hypothetical protein FJZ31_34100 [Candidatus Poribacteria bacterium]|nr:hypothetical protein [Candidatus Poribacteria bacterium]
MEVAHVLQQSKLGVYDNACRDFAEQIINVDGVLAVGAKPYLGHVDIWTITRNYDYELEGKIINSLLAVMAKYDNLLVDFLILPSGILPKDYTVIYEVNDASPIST